MQTFKISTTVCFGDNAMDALAAYAGESVVIFTEPFMIEAGTAQKITDRLTGVKNVAVFDRVRPDPTVEIVTAGLRFLLEHDADVVIALGGGSAIDTAKATVLMANQTDTEKHVRLVAIPTTSGTGSEVTNFAVITDTERGIKVPLVSDGLLADVAILDPSLVVTVPPRITADTGFDVITHSLESYISTNANDCSDALAEKALCLCFDYLPIAYKHGDDIEARQKMHCASCLAGMAFNATSLGINHSIAHQLGAKFHIPHGRANAMLLPHVMLFNADLESNFGEPHSNPAAHRLGHIARINGMTGDNTNEKVLALIARLTYMLRMTDTPETLGACGVTRQQYEAVREELIQGALADTCTKTNPRPVTASDIAAILDKIAVF